MTGIPIQNIYYIFCYAWQRFDIGHALQTGSDDCPDIQSLLAKVLNHGTRNILRRGLDRDYLTLEEETKSPRGRMILGETIKKNLLHKGQIYCQFDELKHNILHNQIIKSTLAKLSKAMSLDRSLREESKSLYMKFSDVDEIRIHPRDYANVKLHRNNSYYEFLLRICQLINAALLPDRTGKNYRFADVLNDPEKMGLVFQDFLYHFYQLEQTVFRVKSETLQWDASPTDEAHRQYLPRMLTDVSLISPNRKIIFEAKFYRETLTKNRGSEKIKSDHLYQLYAYLINSEKQDPLHIKTEGVLIYPVVDKTLDLSFDMRGHKLRVYTLNLNRDWQNIKSDLLSLIQ